MFLEDENISQAVFFPRKAEEPKDLDENIKVIKLKIHEDVIIGGILYLNDKSLPTILMFHGNGEIALDYQYFYEQYFECGVNLAVMDFRGYGFSSHKPTYMSLINDAMPIYEKFTEYREDIGLTNSLFIKGRSLGSVCAAEIGSHNPDLVNGMIFESSFASVYNMMNRLFRIRGPNITPDILQPYSNDTKATKIQKPTLIIHGTNDWIIPNSEGQLLYDSLPDNIYKRFILIEGAGHNNIFSFTEEYFQPLEEFISRYK
ncbi:MAG: hypothetical protein EU547_03800 [Promethearchaeota archaeon]|nr:MAG: hypothetical protein EU547_03800 [Candidatus Lokiarchaeota archaeon]